RLVLPLPFPGLNAVNAYLLTGTEAGAGSAGPPSKDGATLVDCGMRNPQPEGDHGWDDLTAALEAAGGGVDAIARLAVTHTHIDHYGMAARIVSETGCELWMHRCAHEDLELYRDPEGRTASLRELLADHGASPDELDELTQFEDWRPFVSGVVDATHPCDGGETFSAGDRTWTVVHTPGHARSHVCLWSDFDGLLISGDHLLPTITPHIDFERGGEEDPLGEFLDSLQKIEELDPQMVLPGHGKPFLEGADRARVIARHHDRRLGNILQVIRREPRSATEIVDEVFGSELLHFERRLALGEALAHLAYLRKRGEVERIETEDGKLLYRKVSRRRPAEIEE
ncbi:MAG: MBL fold metallo-hydrolase, partial [Actinomycetota bacterium]|nr:MBL fold metallo-hydrolase [Actinomycetota bacterium]